MQHGLRRKTDSMKTFIAQEWVCLLDENGLAGFDALWQVDVPLLDQPNTGRGRNGWSTVGLLSLPVRGGTERKLIIKRQQNYVIRTLWHPLRGIPTLQNEASSTLRFNRLGIPTMKLVYYAGKRERGDFRAILLTEFLEGYESLDRLGRHFQGQRGFNRAERHQLISSVAQVIRTMHEKRLRHNSLYPKHIFLRRDGGEVAARLIDLEKARWSPLGRGRRIRDLDSLNRRSPGWSRADRLRFFKAYCQTDRLSSKDKELYRVIGKKGGRKS
ncbi:MAG TPA: lipopolysaccharide kinase [Deltaproteobacteria bacterium]|nr:lipopolysaccharide kinase [Deltaproteobacteria bacterium]